MEKKKDKNDLEINFLSIVKKAYEKGLNDSEITVYRLIEEIKTDLKNLRI